MRVILMMLVVGWMPTGLFADEPAEPSRSKEKVSEKPTSFWMQKKLDYSAEILRGLATEDYELINDSATQLRLLNKVEGFVRRRNPEYRSNLLAFERLTSEVVRQADKQNIDGVALAFNQLTVSCIRCHQTLRDFEGSGSSESEPEQAGNPSK